MFTQIQFDTVTHQDSIGGLLEKLHKSPSNRQGNDSEYDCQEHWRLNQVTVWFYAGNEDITDDCTNGYNQDDSNIYEEFGCSMTNEKLSTTSQHQIE